MNKKIFLLLTLVYSLGLMGQSNNKGIIQGRIFNSKNNEPVEFASVAIWGTSIGSTSDLDGKFVFTGV